MYESWNHSWHRVPTKDMSQHQTLRDAIRFCYWQSNKKNPSTWRLQCEGYRGIGIKPPSYRMYASTGANKYWNALSHTLLDYPLHCASAKLKTVNILYRWGLIHPWWRLQQLCLECGQFQNHPCRWPRATILCLHKGGHCPRSSLPIWGLHFTRCSCNIWGCSSGRLYPLLSTKGSCFDMVVH